MSRRFGRIYWREDRKAWYVRAYILGRRLNRPFDSKASAESFLARLKAEVDREAATGVRAIEKCAFSSFVEEYLAIVKREHTASTYQSEAAKLNRAKRHFGATHVSEIRREDIERYLAILGAEGAGIAGRNRHVSLLSAAFKRAMALGYCRENPATGVRKPRETEREVPALSFEDQAKFVNACSDRVRPLVEVLLGTGIRLGEALALEWRQVDFKGMRLRISRSKNKRPKDVPMTSGVAAVLEALAERRGPRPIEGPDRVFAWIRPGSRSGSMRGAFKAAAKAAGLGEGFRIHDLRHVFSVNAVRAGVTLPDLAKINGHSLAMAMRYARHVPGNVVDETRKKLEAALAAPPPKAASGDSSGPQ